MSAVVYIPTGLASPELEILLAKAQSAIDAGEATTVVTCAGGDGYACSLNIYGLRAICRVCRSSADRGVETLRGSYRHLRTPAVIKLAKRGGARETVLGKRQAIKNHIVDGADVGLAAYSSYIGLSRDLDLEGRLAKWSLNQLLSTSEQLFPWFSDLLRQVDATRVVLYNGRQNQYRPLLRAAQQQQISVDVMEFAGQEACCVYTFRDELPQHLDVLNAYVAASWAECGSEAEEAGRAYYSLKRAGGVINDHRSYVLGQQQGMLPQGWDATKHNVAIFNSSEDELAALGGEYDETLYRNQTEAITRLCEALHDDPDVVIWLRIHPNLAKVRWSFAQRLLRLADRYRNVHVIPGDAPVSSYGLLDASDTALSFGSTMGVEAAYWGKPSILVGRCIYERLGSVYTPRSHAEVVALVKARKLPPLPVEGALKVALFWSRGGHAIPHFGGNRKQGFDFDGHKIAKSPFEQLHYNFAKVVEKILLGDVINYGLGRTRQQLNEPLDHALPDS